VTTETEALTLIRRLKRDLMHARRFQPDTLQTYRNACIFAEGDIEEFLISVDGLKQPKEQT
jgi:hypothetical protein